MNLFLVTRIALRAIGKNKLRSWLTVIGVVIGVAAVTTMVSLGQSATKLVEDQLYSLGTNVLAVVPESRSMTRQALKLTAEDSDAILRECSTISASTPIVGVAGTISFGNAHRRPAMAGVGMGYLEIRNWPLAYGEFFSERDIKSSEKVCVLGRTVVVRLFQTGNPLGQTVRIRNIPFRVIGVLKPKGANIFGQDQDDLVLLPYSTVSKRLRSTGKDSVDSIIVSAYKSEETRLAKAEITRLLKDRRSIGPTEPTPFQVADMKEYAVILDAIMTTLTLTLAAIAGISLLVGGIGIMNIMLVSVTERTREIGIRMAVGADASDIMRQFLVEAVVLSTMGGLVGVLLGIGASLVATRSISALMPDVDLPMVVSAPAAIVALLVAAGVGIFFGYYPARRASRLDPIEALRYE